MNTKYSCGSDRSIFIMNEQGKGRRPTDAVHKNSCDRDKTIGLDDCYE